MPSARMERRTEEPPPVTPVLLYQESQVHISKCGASKVFCRPGVITLLSKNYGPSSSPQNKSISNLGAILELSRDLKTESEAGKARLCTIPHRLQSSPVDSQPRCIEVTTAILFIKVLSRTRPIRDRFLHSISSL
jgi:hypothetical protein